MICFVFKEWRHELQSISQKARRHEGRWFHWVLPATTTSVHFSVMETNTDLQELWSLLLPQSKTLLHQCFQFEQICWNHNKVQANEWASTTFRQWRIDGIVQPAGINLNQILCWRNRAQKWKEETASWFFLLFCKLHKPWQSPEAAPLQKLQLHHSCLPTAGWNP